MYLKCIHQKDAIHFNFSVVIYIRIAFQHILDNLEDYNFSMDYYTDKNKVIREIDALICNPEVRINERPFLEFENYQISNENLYSKDGFKVGKILEYRLDFENVNINVHEDLKMYPFDVQSLKLRIEFTSKELNGKTFRYNLHNCLTSKNLILGVYKSPNLDNMDSFNLYNNKKGFSYKLCSEDKKYGPNLKKVCKYYPVVEYYIRMYRDPGYCFKVAILPMIILLFFASGVNYFGSLDVQYQDLLVFYLAFLSFMQVANSGIQKTNAIHMVDYVIIVAYVLTLMQYLILILNGYPNYINPPTQEDCDPSDCACVLENEQETMRINLLSYISFWITVVLSGSIAIYFTLYLLFFYIIKKKEYNRDEDLNYDEEEPFDFNHWFLLSDGDGGNVLWDYNQKNYCIL